MIHITVLHQFEHDIGVNRVGVEALIGSLVIRLELHHGVLSHSDIQVLLHLLRSEDESLHAAGRFVFSSVGMDRKEEVSVILVRYVCARLERNKDICRTGINDLHIRVALVDLFAYLEHELEVKVFLLREPSYSACILAAMTGIEDERIGFLRPHRQA